jgi:ribose/xylose/arabinose/galactoside ABC-type transport system permease subunit
LAALAGLPCASQLSVGAPIAGQGYELDAIAAVVVGILANILNLTGVDPFVQQLFKGRAARHRVAGAD